MNAILQALFALVPFSTDLLNVTDRLEADSDNILALANNHWSVVMMLTLTMTLTTMTARMILT